MKPHHSLDMDKIAEALGAERQGRVQSTSGHFGAVQIAAEVQARFRSPPGGGRSTDPSWSEQRLVRLAPETLQRLEQLAETLSEAGVRVSPLQVAALLLESATSKADTELLSDLAALSA